MRVRFAIGMWLLAISLGVPALFPSAAAAVDPQVTVGMVSGAAGTTVQVPISIVRNSNAVTGAAVYFSFDPAKFTPGTCLAQTPFSNTGANGGNDMLASNGKICSTYPSDKVACSTDSDCSSGTCSVALAVGISTADSNPADTLADTFVQDGTFLLCPFTITAGTAVGVYDLTALAGEWTPASGADNPASAVTGSIEVLLDTDGDTIPDVTDNCDYTANVSQTDTGGIGNGSPPDGIGNACQCGDVNGDGRVLTSDSTIILRSLLTPPTATQANPQLCDVGGSTGCFSGDSTIILRALLTPPTTTVMQKCAPALP